MSFNADSFFARGKTHMVCEDYARAGFQQNGLPYAIVCDGCSSSDETDTGARLLAHSAAFQMQWITAGEATFAERERQVIDAAANAANELDVDMRCLDSTLVAAHWARDEEGNPGVRVSMRGDGVIAARMRDPEARAGGPSIVVVDHLRNAPRYLSYDLEPGRREGYLDRFGETSHCRLYSGANGWLQDRGYSFEGHHPDWFYPADLFDIVMVLSDGVQTFQRVVRTGTSKTLDPVPVEQVIEQLFRIKGTKGDFVKRRCHKFLSVYCTYNEWQHADDFSAAAIWMGEPT